MNERPVLPTDDERTERPTNEKPTKDAIEDENDKTQSMNEEMEDRKDDENPTNDERDEKDDMDNDSDNDYIMEGDAQSSIKALAPKKAKNTASSTSENRGENDLAKIKLHDFKFIEKMKPGEGRKKDKVTVTAYVDFKFQMYR